MGQSRIFTVEARWDGEAGVWTAYSDAVPGLATEAITLEQLVAKLEVVVPELLELNGVLDGASPEGIAIKLRAERTIVPSAA